MVQQRTEFPEIEAWRSELDRQKSEARRQVEDGIYTGKLNAAAEQWLARVSKQLEEVNYVLNYFEMVRFRQTQNWQTWQTIALLTVAALALALSIFSVWRG